jgi:CheY-like chemotaxis protein
LLVAEDDEVDVLLLRRALLSTGAPVAVDFVHDGQATLEQLEQRRAAHNLPKLLLLDLKMPRLDGLQTLQRIRAQAALRHLPVIVFSSSAHPGDVSRAYALGANAFLLKPQSLVDRAEIARFLVDWLRLNHLGPGEP